MIRALIISGCLVIVSDALGLWPAVIAAAAYIAGYAHGLFTGS